MQVSRGKDWVSLARPLYVQRPGQSLNAPAPRPQRAASTRELRNQCKLSEAPRGRPLRAPRQKGVLRRLSTAPAPGGPPPPAPTAASAARPRGARPGDSRRLRPKLPAPTGSARLERDKASPPQPPRRPRGPPGAETRARGNAGRPAMVLNTLPRRLRASPETGAEGGPGAPGSGRLLSPWAACTHRHGQPKPLVTHHLAPAARAAAAAGSAPPGRCVRGGSYRRSHGSRLRPNLAGPGCALWACASGRAVML
uniref:Uncharacterized protein n=1 Tax=Rangifer tarandus platyrhynchus TaxID=3082113 RepID=A0ACB0FAP0_RANTA|nr:unnamed protein product [Rangifer tarandus platyrhynchus]